MTNGALVGVHAVLDGPACVALVPWLRQVLDQEATLAPAALDGLRAIARAAEAYRQTVTDRGVSATVSEPSGLSVVEAAELLGIGEAGVRWRLRTGTLAGWRVDGRWVVDLTGVSAEGAAG